MPETQHLPIVITLLAAAVIAVSLFRKLHISPVLGYLAAGALIGPGALGLVYNTESMAPIAELGVVFLLFIIGLELSWERLKAISKRAYALGVLQIVITSACIISALHVFRFSTQTAIIIGCGLTMSSTAIVMQLLEERNQKASQLGRIALAVLIIQDLAVVPLLVLVPTFAHDQQSAGMQLVTVIVKAAAAMTLIFFSGRIVLRPLYRVIASTGNPEIFTALTLLVVLGTGWLTGQAGLSLALGAFIAGLLMAETEYRHQVEADVMPYKGLLLGLFFMAVGMSADLGFIGRNFAWIATLSLVLIAIKGFFIFIMSRLLGFAVATSIQSATLLSQGGEFTFVLFRLAGDMHFLDQELAGMLTAIVIFSMALTPITASLGRMATARLEHKTRRKADDLVSETLDIKDHVIIIGFGRVGQTIAKLLSAENINYVALDMQIETVGRAKKIGLPVYYGDGARREVLQAIGVERASSAIVTVNHPAASENAVRAIRAAAPHIPIIARALDLKRVLRLEEAGANVAVSEMFEASLQLGGALLRSIGVVDTEISRILTLFRDRDYALAQGTIDAAKGDANPTPYDKMLAFQKAVVKGSVLK